MMIIQSELNPRVATIHFFVTYTGVFSSINQCMRPILLCILLGHISIFSFAGKVSGLITDNEGNPLPYASIIVKGTNKGTTANSSGRYAISLSSGQYTLVAQYVGYAKVEKPITVTIEDQVVDFRLLIQQLTLPEVIVKKGEDPAYEIIRNAIKKRIIIMDR